ncbi:hypothetical protein GTW10_24005, partial [Aurantimonas endophytica]|nr:hypothetical protein [Aurantimonas endophytica]
AAIQKDRIIVIEIMVDEIEDAWWKDYRAQLEAVFEQEEVLIRVTPCRKI